MNTPLEYPALVNARVDLPPHSCDAHQHVIDEAFPMASSRSYTPGPALLDSLRSLHWRFEIERAVLVQPSFYGVDNSCLLHALRQLGNSGRSVVVIDETTSDYDLDKMHETGVRAVRINPKGHADNPAVVGHLLEIASERVASRGWHVQPLLPLRTRLVLDHFGSASKEGVDQMGST
ncbi:amidohydrolase 2 [Caballeronia udeis]|uniref:Amidohydrolase 2 n=1 Tax=Caballeronia udeis TaxID=1232866 RepID=A0A158K1Y3_9BURK|nr:amidohydrolase family protein [Caballeronia udeis]SAL74491.1 amidohydrolase 2 [Caballeronia udeis]